MPDVALNWVVRRVLSHFGSGLVNISKRYIDWSKKDGWTVDT